MKPRQTQLPKGARIYLPDEAERKRHVEASLLGVFRRWGYREIVTPTFEFSDVLATGTDVDVQGNMFTLVDRETGRTLALRPDITPQIARVVATRLRDEPKPIRLAYVTNVFRYDEPRVSHYREFYQAGVELVGLDQPEAEVEVIAMAIEGLRALGLERFQIDLSHPDFFRGLHDEAKTDAAQGRPRLACPQPDGRRGTSGGGTECAAMELPEHVAAGAGPTAAVRPARGTAVHARRVARLGAGCRSRVRSARTPHHLHPPRRERRQSGGRQGCGWSRC